MQNAKGGKIMSIVKTRDEWFMLLNELANLSSLKHTKLIKFCYPIQYDENLSEEEKTFDNLFEKAKSALHNVGADLQMESYTDAMKFDIVFLTASSDTIVSVMKNAVMDEKFLTRNQLDFRLLMLISETLIVAEEYELASKPLNIVKGNWQDLELIDLKNIVRDFATLVSGILLKIQEEVYPDEKKAGQLHILKSEIVQIAFFKTREEREAIWAYTETKKKNPKMIETFELILEIVELMRKAEML